MAGLIGNLPYWEIRFTQDGQLAGDGGLSAELREGPVSELFIFAHGWNASEDSARDLSRALFSLLSDQAAKHAASRAKSIGTVALFWPSLLFPEDDPATAGPDGIQRPSSGAGLATVLRPAFQPPQQDALTRIGQLIDAKPPDPQSLQECHDLIGHLVTSPDLGAVEDAGESAVVTRPAAEVFGELAGMSKSRDAAGEAPDPFTTLWHGAREALRTASYYEMKNRAGVVGQKGLGPLVSQLAAARPGLRVHLLGHSFGARLAAYCLAGLPPAAADQASPVKSLTLIQGAFSHFTFAQPMPIDASRDGHLAAVRDRVDGPLLATFSAADRAVGWWYPAASMLSHADSESAIDLTYRWGGMGHDGYQHPDVIQLDLQADGKPYTFKKGHCYRLKSDAVIRADQSVFSGAHSDIRHPEVIWASLAAAL
jgi:hypothetical protein